MVEYGHGVGEVAGRSGGGAGGAGGNQDMGAAFGQLINDPISTIAAMPPEMLLIGLVAAVFALLFLKRAL